MSRNISLFAVVLLAAALVIPTAALAQNPHNLGALPVAATGIFASSPDHPGPLTNLGSGAFAGTFNIQKFAVSNDSTVCKPTKAPCIVAIGTLTGTLTNTSGQVSNLAVGGVVLPVTDPPDSCDILALTLGPLHLDLLGLVVDLNQVNLNITAQPGSGNLLGNLLCSVAGLLNNGGPLTAVANLLNQILGALTGALGGLGL
jgi:hypothetical protein